MSRAYWGQEQAVPCRGRHRYEDRKGRRVCVRCDHVAPAEDQPQLPLEAA